MTARLHGRSAELRVDDRTLAQGAEWSLDIGRDYDVTRFGDETMYYPTVQRASGTFSGVFDDGFPIGLSEASKVKLHLPYALPWWRAWFYRLPGREWPTYEAISGDAAIDYSARDGVVDGEFRITGPITYNSQPWTRWQTLKWRLGQAWLKFRAPKVEPESEPEPTGQYWCQDCRETHDKYDEGWDDD